MTESPKSITIDTNLLERAREFHGHVCPFLVLGLLASEIAKSELGVSKAGVYETIHEELVAVVEANNCMADGVQVATGCTLGNNSLIYLDTGKNALTLYRRSTGEGVRVYVDWERISGEFLPRAAGGAWREGSELWRKVVVERSASREEAERLHALWEQVALKLLELPADYFKVSRVKVSPIERAPIFESVKCARCGELVAKPRAVATPEGYLCPACARASVNGVIGRGIVVGLQYPVEVMVG
ncbi:FmdE family protein [Infirmifilum sp. SLHALR2]|nr:MAG: formylmethanofuran dehydrogenase [Thermofilum sp. NZ13]